MLTLIRGLLRILIVIILAVSTLWMIYQVKVDWDTTGLESLKAITTFEELSIFAPLIPVYFLASMTLIWIVLLAGVSFSSDESLISNVFNGLHGGVLFIILSGLISFFVLRNNGYEIYAALAKTSIISFPIGLILGFLMGINLASNEIRKNLRVKSLQKSDVEN